MPTYLLFQTSFRPGTRDEAAAAAVAALPELRSLPEVTDVTVLADANDEDGLWAIWTFADYDDIFRLYERPSFKAFTAEVGRFATPNGARTHVLRDMAQGAET